MERGGQDWNGSAGYGAPPPPLIGIGVGFGGPELDIPPLSIATPGLQMNPSIPQPAVQLTQDQLDVLSMSGTITLAPGVRVGRQGVRGDAPHAAAYGAPGLEMQPGVQLTHQDIDYLSNTGTLTLQPGLQVGSKGFKAPPNTQHQPQAQAKPPQKSEVESLKDLDVKHQLGAGASAKVFLAQHRQTGKLYALKDMQVSLDRRALYELGTEIQISRTVESDHVVKCYNAFYEEGHMTLVLEFMDAGSVADLLGKAGRIAEFYLADIARQALQGFKDLHTHRPNPIIHRDIKPSNLLLNLAGQLKISDFGVSRVLEDSNDVGKTFAGTFTYMSPERIVGQHYRCNSDIWSFGLSLLECAVGEYPYQPAMDYFTLLNAVKNRDPPRAPSDEFSPEFCNFIDCCLQKDPQVRWSAEQLLGHPFCRKFANTRLVDLMMTLQ